MFDLERAIAEWRRQMLDAGIKAPVPLEELEVHLREEIQQLTQAGRSETEAFSIAVQSVGQQQLLQKEFEKVEKEIKTKRAILLAVRAAGLIIGWLAAGIMLSYGVGMFEINQDLWSFHPTFDRVTAIALLIIMAAEIGIWFLAKAGRDRASRAVSLLGCLFLAGLAVVSYQHNIHPTGILGGARDPDPLWFRIVVTLMLITPGAFWIWWERRHVVEEHNRLQENQPAHSN